MIRLPAVILSSILILTGGYVHGLWTDRWGMAAEPAAAVERYAKIPWKVGDWHGESIEGGDARPYDAAGAVQRRYVNRRTGQVVMVALVCGRPGPVSIHTPDACYGASGYVVGKPERATTTASLGEFWTTEAVRNRATEETRLRLFWAWNAGQGWSAPEEGILDSPRQRFAAFNVLHKLYVIREKDGKSETVKEEPCLAFMTVFIPELDQVLFPAETSGEPRETIQAEKAPESFVARFLSAIRGLQPGE